MLTDQWKRIFRSLIERLDAVKVALESISENTKPKQQTAKQQYPAPPVNVSAVLQLPPEVSDYYKSKSAKRPGHKVPDWLVFTVSVLTLCALVAYTVVTKKMWTEQIKANAISHQNLIYGQSAFVFFSPALNMAANVDPKKPTIARGWNFYAPFQNTGNTPTRELTIGGTRRIREYPIPYEDTAAENAPRIFLGPKVMSSTSSVFISVEDIQLMIEFTDGLNIGMCLKIHPNTSRFTVFR